MVTLTVRDGALPLVTDLTVRKGDTLQLVVHWETATLSTKAISAITKAAPAVLTSTAHGIPDGWRVAVASAGGMRQINAKHYPPYSSEYHVADTAASTVTLPDVNSAEYDAYTSGGYLVFYSPHTLASYTARMQIRAAADAADTLASFTSAAGDIVIDDTGKEITLTVPAATTAAYTFASGVFDFELVSADATPVVTKLLSGTVTVSDEITR